ncbi:ABC transporter ATP-binding protein [Dactylosporangium sp. NPDC000244]|uniref:ABC transporter ATP-binding protein n=1 Tax=Dactylosporangium sp. NPDC000244 TaxID=3154365 RepID=UPI0033339BB3
MTASHGAIQFDNVRKEYADHVAVDDLTLTIEPGEFFTVLGPSGSGKTTTLMMLAGFTDPTSGTIRVDGVDIAHTPSDKRNIGVVFQDYALFPHMSVRDNLAFPLEMRKERREVIAERVDRALELVDMTAAANRLPDQLSGGQRQRIAVARAVVFDPAFLLMDEPLGALDRKLRQRLQVELRQLQQALKVTMVYVTHDQEEAMSMSDRIALMNHGRIEQMGTPRELYEHPRSAFVADFLGTNNMLAVRPEAPGRLSVENGGLLPVDDGRVVPADASVAAVRPERIALTNIAATPPPGFSHCTGKITHRLYLGSHTMYTVHSETFGPVRVQMQHDDGEHPYRTGETVGMIWRTRDVNVFGSKAER